MDKTKVQRLTNNIVYLPSDHDTDRPILMAVSGQDRTLIVDAGNSPAHASLFMDQLAGLNLPSVELMVLTHWHWDHVFGMKTMNLPTIAHKKTYDYLHRMVDYSWDDAAIDARVAVGTEIAFCADMIKKEFGSDRDITIELPTMLFEERVEVDLGGITCVVEHVGGDHADDSCVIYVKEQKVLFLGDCLGSSIYDGPRYYTSSGILHVLEKIESYGAEIFIESHWKPLRQDEIQKDLDDMRKLALSVQELAGDRDKLLAEMKQHWGRDLEKDEIEFVDQLIRGLDIRSIPR